MIVAFINIILRKCRTTFTTPEATGNVDDTELFMRHTLRLYLKMRERVAEEDDVEVGVNDREASNERVEDHLRANVHLADDSELSVCLADELRALRSSCGPTPCSLSLLREELRALRSSLRTNSALSVHLADKVRAEVDAGRVVRRVVGVVEALQRPSARRRGGHQLARTPTDADEQEVFDGRLKNISCGCTNQVDFSSSIVQC